MPMWDFGCDCSNKIAGSSLQSMQPTTAYYEFEILYDFEIIKKTFSHNSIKASNKSLSKPFRERSLARYIVVSNIALCGM